jgi:hypothetical protein
MVNSIVKKIFYLDLKFTAYMTNSSPQYGIYTPYVLKKGFDAFSGIILLLISVSLARE